MKKGLGFLLALVLCAGLLGCNATGTVTPPSESALPPVAIPEQESAALVQAREDAIAKAELMAEQYFYDEALNCLTDPALENDEVAAKRAEIQGVKDSLVKFDGTIKHIFFHSLIVYPEMIFKDKITPMGGYNAGFSEKAELERMLPQLYERGYVLYDLNECFEQVDGKMVRKDIWLPPGKEPLILSVDDVAYSYGRGFAQKLTINEAGALVNLVKNPQGEIEEMVDGDVFGVVKLFVEKHPDFSYQGHKGTLAMTGFEGAFGFPFETTQGQEQIMRVAAALRAEGWNFASHSYTHNRKNYFGPNSLPEKIAYDTKKWISHVSPYLGETNLFIVPFGYRVKQPGLQHILDAGFDIYCTVNKEFINEVYDDYALMSRIEMGGYSMSHFQDVLNEHLFRVDEVFDATGRPPVIG